MSRVALYIPNLMQGGAERVVSRLSFILSEKYEVDIILNDEKIQFETDCKIINMHLPAGSNYLSRLFLLVKRVKCLRRIKKEKRYKCVISFLNNANIVNILSKTKNTASIVSIRSFYNASYYKGNAKTMALVLSKLYVFADWIIPVSKYNESQLVKGNAKLKHKITTIYNPFDIKQIEEMSQLNEVSAEDQTFMNDKIIILFVGRLSYEKGLWNLMKAMKSLSQRSDIGLILVGDGKERGKIEHFIQENNLKNTRLVGHKSNPYPYFSRADVFVLPSLVEGFPNVIGESLACGVPVVAADCKTGPREILAPELSFDEQIDNIYWGKYGVLIPAVSDNENWCESTRDSENIRTAIESLINNDSLYFRYKNNVKTRALDFSYPIIEKRFEDVIERF